MTHSRSTVRIAAADVRKKRMSALVNRQVVTNTEMATESVTVIETKSADVRDRHADQVCSTTAIEIETVIVTVGKIDIAVMTITTEAIVIETGGEETETEIETVIGIVTEIAAKIDIAEVMTIMTEGDVSDEVTAHLGVTEADLVTAAHLVEAPLVAVVAQAET